MRYQGLSEREVEEKRKEFGLNVLPSKEGGFWLEVLISQLANPLMYILAAVGIISLFLKEYIDASLIAVVILLNVMIGFVQEYNARKTLSALNKILKPTTFVVRSGKKKEIEVRDLVPGDLVILEAGNRIPADGKIISDMELLINEAILTGEEEAVLKCEKDAQSDVCMGTIVISGRGLMEVKKTGKETEIGKIGLSLAEIKKERTPFQLKLEQFSKSLAKIALAACFIIFAIGILHGENILEIFRFSIILSIAAIPEGLPVALTVILALGMKRVLKRKGLVKKMLSLETLGSTSVICTDKTGTLTEGTMRVVKTDFSDREKALLALILANNQRSSLEIALWQYAEKEKGEEIQKIFDGSEIIFEEPFDSIRKYELTINMVNGRETAFMVGAPEIILSFCRETKEEKKNFLSLMENWASEGFRILGVAFKEKGDLKTKEDFSWLGIVAVEDSIRRGVRDALSGARKAGIKVKIVTGDWRKTAERVALNLGFNLKPGSVMDGNELDAISDEELKEKIDDILIFARVSPHQKLKIVKALQEKGEVVAMTGDGVNDAPALKKADIAVVMGNASDVAKETGDLILLDGDFKTITAAIEEGRLIFSNVKKVTAYVLSNSFSEIFLIFGSVILDLPFPLTVVQLLWLHLICDGPPDIVLGFEPAEEAIYSENPKDIQKENILSGSMKFLILVISCTVGLAALAFFRYFWQTTGDLILARTVTFATISVESLIYIFAFKSLKKPIIKTKNFFRNKFLFLGVAYGLILALAAVYLPALNKILGTKPLEAKYWILVLAVAFLATLWAELIKFSGKLTKK